MYSLFISETLEAKLEKLKKGDKETLVIISKKVKEIQKNPYHFKPLRHDLKGIRRVHINRSFVLIYEIIEPENAVRLLDFDHHDKIYKI
ncbi:type II toxin-antitoxin system RelE family toxin [Methanolacinia paynteri]|uniref:type II toxin-antitoxin system RelE family toxin n=1 Tax=Methanolacinia paynteri TaxID=230356 RepID=UPI00064E244F|nr:type II toxin-antitoxin system mRNA interferase toxin, RelE/StbE family [Methanolacinia paynteri]